MKTVLWSLETGFSQWQPFNANYKELTAMMLVIDCPENTPSFRLWLLNKVILKGKITRNNFFSRILEICSIWPSLLVHTKWYCWIFNRALKWLPLHADEFLMNSEWLPLNMGGNLICCFSCCTLCAPLGWPWKIPSNRACHPGGHYWDYYLGALSLNQDSATHLKIGHL